VHPNKDDYCSDGKGECKEFCERESGTQTGIYFGYCSEFGMFSKEESYAVCFTQ